MRSFQDSQYDFLKFLLSCHPSSENLRGFPTSPQGLVMLCFLPGSIPRSLFFKHKSFLFLDFPPVAPSGGKAFPLVPPTTSFFRSQQKRPPPQAFSLPPAHSLSLLPVNSIHCRHLRYLCSFIHGYVYCCSPHWTGEVGTTSISHNTLSSQQFLPGTW